MTESDKSDIRLAALGKYLLSLSEMERAVCGRRVNVISRFISGGFQLSKQGYKDFIKTWGYSIKDSERTYLADYLYLAGIRLGGKRKHKERIVKRIDELSESNRIRISSYIEWCMTQREYSPASIRMKTDHMKMFFRYFTEFNAANARSFIASRESEGLHPKSLNMYMITLQQYGEFAKKPVALKKISIQSSMSVENVPTEKEYQKFLTWLYENKKWMIYWAVRVLGSTGMRRSELNQMSWQDILNGEAYPRCKGKKHRVVYFPKRLIADLSTWLKGHEIDLTVPLLYSHRTGKMLSERGFDQVMKLNARKAGFPREKAHCHAFRHFFAKQYLAKTKDVVQLADLLGHESVDTTRLYLQKSKIEQAKDINRNVTW